MIAFKIEVEGQDPIIAGTEDWHVLSLGLTAIRGKRGKHDHPYERVRADDFNFHAGGLSLTDASGISHHFRWKELPITIGSRVVVTVIETDSPDAPVKRYRSDKEVQEPPFTDEEMLEMRRKDYLELKKEFEGQEHG